MVDGVPIDLARRACRAAVGVLAATCLGASLAATTAVASSGLTFDRLPFPGMTFVVLDDKDDPALHDRNKHAFEIMQALARVGPAVPSARRSPAYGSLTHIPDAQPFACPYSTGVAVAPSGNRVYASSVSGASGQLCAFDLDPATHALVPMAGMPFGAGIEPRAVVIDPAGDFLYVVDATANNVRGYALDAASGKPSPLAGSPVATGGILPTALVGSRDGRYLYAANYQSVTGSAGSVAAFAIDRASGALSPVPGSPFAMAAASVTEPATSLALTPDGRYLFAGGFALTTFAVNPSTGALTRLARRGNVAPGGLAVDPTGRFLYVSDFAANQVLGFAIGADGSLTPAGTAAIGAGARGIAVLGDLVYAASATAGQLHGFRLDGTTGALTPVAGSPYAVPTTPDALAGRMLLSPDREVEVGDYFAVQLGGSGGRPPYAWSIVAGSLPTGVSLNASTGVISGTAASGGKYEFTAQIADSAGATATAARSITVFAATAATASAVEFYHAGFDHYFITYGTDEIAKLDAGTTIKGWTRTGKSFPVYTAPQAASSPVCRYYIPPDLGNSHFFGRGTAECNATGQKNPSFVLEDPAFMHMVLPTAGVCPSGTTSAYRVFSDRPDANHRYTTDKAVRDEMVAKGWLAEGDGPDLVVMCAPQ